MFTGVIEEVGEVLHVAQDNGNRLFTVRSQLAKELTEGQSVNHNGVCLTISSLDGSSHQATAIAETLARSNLSEIQTGSLVNLERAMPANGRFDGHIVQGHVDDVLTCISQEDLRGSLRFGFDLKNTQLIVEKGSVCLDGVSLTVSSLDDNSFTVDIVPFTMEHTTFKQIRIKDKVNVEYDVLGKYVQRTMGQ